MLHVQPDAPKEIIQSSYRTLMQKLKAHPDLGGEEWNAAFINEAYEVLMDAKKREAYNKKLFQEKNRHILSKQNHKQRQRQEPNAGPAPVAEVYDDWQPFQATVIDKA